MSTEDTYIWYFAYGSNMSSKTFQRGFRRLNPSSTERAMLRGYRLAFSEPGIPFFDPSFANVEKDDTAVCEGVLYRITHEEMDHLDISEGNRAYNIIDIQVEGFESGTVMAKTFQSKEHAHGLLPSKRYMDILIEGAMEHGLSNEWITMLQSQPYVDRSGYTWLRHKVFWVIRHMNRSGIGHPFKWWKKHHVRKTARKNAIPPSTK